MARPELLWDGRGRPHAPRGQEMGASGQDGERVHTGGRAGRPGTVEPGAGPDHGAALSLSFPPRSPWLWGRGDGSVGHRGSPALRIRSGRVSSWRRSAVWFAGTISYHGAGGLSRGQPRRCPRPPGKPVLWARPLPHCSVPTGPQRPAAHLRGEAPGLRGSPGQRGLQAPGDGCDRPDTGSGPRRARGHPNVAPAWGFSLDDTPFMQQGQQVCVFEICLVSK